MSCFKERISLFGKKSGLHVSQLTEEVTLKRLKSDHIGGTPSSVMNYLTKERFKDLQTLEGS